MKSFVLNFASMTAEEIRPESVDFKREASRYDEDRQVVELDAETLRERGYRVIRDISAAPEIANKIAEAWKGLPSNACNYDPTIKALLLELSDAIHAGTAIFFGETCQAGYCTDGKIAVHEQAMNWWLAAAGAPKLHSSSIS